MSYEESQFYCLACGRRGIPCLRPHSHQRASGHRKKLYCIHCKQVINHYECRSDEDRIEFEERFEAGEFQEEARISIKECAENG
jgi:hypothetical protein